MNKFSVLILLLFITSCKSQQIPSSDHVVIKMQKTPCFGSCPEYEITIFDNKMVYLDAKQFLPLKGKFVSRLSDEGYKQLVEKFVESDFFDYQEEYTSNITDLPTTNVTFKYKEKKKTVSDYHGAPESLKKLEQSVHGLIDQLDWKEHKED